MKFRRNKDICLYLGLVIYDYLPEVLSELDSIYNFSDPLIITVPSSLERNRNRGYCPNEEIIKSFIRPQTERNYSFKPKAIRKIKNTKPQSWSKNKSERIQNPIGCFTLLKPHYIKNQNIILFDDVMTTGATLSECEKILRQAGAKKILKFVIAH